MMMSTVTPTKVKRARQEQDLAADSDSGYASLDSQVASPRVEVALSPKSFIGSPSAAQAQLKYNHDRHEISRSINEANVVAAHFKDQATNAEWPMQVPLIDESAMTESRPTLARATTSLVGREEVIESPSRASLRRTTTSQVQREQAVASASPDVLSTSCQQQLQILRPEILLSAHEGNIIHTMNPKAVGDVMERQFIKVQQHLRSLQVRVEDVSSKVLVTGDLNAGKSTFCNALMRQDILPTDQQPCTGVFCEVIDARENEDQTGVHATNIFQSYARDDKTTYASISYSQLADAVQSPAIYSSLKVFVDDKRSITDSLLRNGVVDISLIDAPGLNADSLQTTAVYARQEEIDVIVFVVSAENHFTLSAKQFLWNAANEKAHIFIVVNRFDTIKDKQRCRKIILEQIAKLSPQTHAAADELVHFVSSDRVIEADTEDPDFAELEKQLRNFVLNKRSQSKLAPARNFVQKFWSDTRAIATYNIDVAHEELSKLKVEVTNIDGKLMSLTRERQEVLEQVTANNEALCEKVRIYTKEQLTSALQSLHDVVPQYAYAGLYDCYTYAAHLRDQYLQTMLSASVASEMQCRGTTSSGVDAIRSIGLSHLSESQYKLKPFNVALMFSRKRDAIQRNLPIELSVLDFIDLAKFETLLGTSSLSAALVLYGGKTLGWSAIVESSLKVLNSFGIERSPKLVAGMAVIGLSGIGIYVATQVPNALQKNLSKKVMAKVQSSGYIEANANRISNECRKVLNTPETELRVSFASIFEAEERAKASLQKRSAAATQIVEFFKKQQNVITREQKRIASVSL